MKTLSIPAQMSLFLPRPHERRLGWIAYEDKVVIVIIKANETIILKTGHICSTPHSHLKANNVDTTIVWGDEPFRDTDDPDDAYERSFNVSDPNLLKLDEVQSLKDERVAINYFEGIYPPEMVRRISQALSTQVLERAPVFYV